MYRREKPIRLPASPVGTHRREEQLERRALNQENLGSNPLAAILKLWQFCSSHIATVDSAI